MKMTASPGGGAPILERSTRVNSEVHPASITAAATTPNRPMMYRGKFGCIRKVGIFTAGAVIPVIRRRFYRIVWPASCPCCTQASNPLSHFSLVCMQPAYFRRRACR